MYHNKVNLSKGMATKHTTVKWSIVCRIMKGEPEKEHRTKWFETKAGIFAPAPPSNSITPEDKNNRLYILLTEISLKMFPNLTKIVKCS